MAAEKLKYAFGYYVELRSPGGHIARVQSTVRATDESVVRLMIERQAAKNNSEIVDLIIWAEDDESASLEALNSYYKAEEKTNDTNKSAVVYTSPKVEAAPEYVPIVPQDPPKKGFASLPCFEKMQKTPARGKAKDRREEYDFLYLVATKKQ